MLFNSVDFLLFFAFVTTVHFALPRRVRWGLLLLASCVFYMFFVPAYVLILAGTILVDYFAGIGIEMARTRARKSLFLWLSVLSVCATLFTFKYFNFFASNVMALSEALHWRYSVTLLRWVLPIGLSFHTFQSLSYVIEVYFGRQRAERHLGIYALYVMYYPQLVAGPIERPQNLLPQLRELPDFDWSRTGQGLLLSMWGLFKKVVIADAFSLYVDAAYNSPAQQTGKTLAVATYLFAFQIYCDFSGYSDMARGISRIYGVELMQNFETPYFSQSVSEFWSRWHISLSTWFKDYVYIPLGGNRRSTGRTVLNVFIVFLLSGVWHGANWTFVIWGALHGFYVICERLAFRNKPTSNRGLLGLLRIVATFHFVLAAWVFFRARSASEALHILGRIARFTGPVMQDVWLVQGVVALLVLLACETLRARYSLSGSNKALRALSPALGLALLFTIVLFGVNRSAEFIYFQF